MRVCVRGIRELDFKTADGEVKGTQVFYSYPSEGIIGEKVDKLFLRKGFPLPAELAPGKYLDIFCDTKGHVEHIQPVNTSAGKYPTPGGNPARSAGFATP